MNQFVRSKIFGMKYVKRNTNVSTVRMTKHILVDCWRSFTKKDLYEFNGRILCFNPNGKSRQRIAHSVSEVTKSGCMKVYCSKFEVIPIMQRMSSTIFNSKFKVLK